MAAIPVIAVFDVGKTNKKLFLFDEHYKIVWERSACFDEIKDEDGDICEDIKNLGAWIKASWQHIGKMPEFDVRAVNFSAYGASLVHIGQDGKPLTPLYNYLKAYPKNLTRKFYDAYGGEAVFSQLTASPVLGSLNSGLQLFRLKEENPGLFSRIRSSLHLPQYLSFLLTGRACSDITSIGCHTGLWNFSQRQYHEWVYREGIIHKLAPILPSSSVLPVLEDLPGKGQVSGIGLHDSSAAMIPYLESFREPFVLISTGTWCISMNPFNDSPLTSAELEQDCLCYINYQGKAVKASRIFAGYEHEQKVKKLAAYFQKDVRSAAGVVYDEDVLARLRSREQGKGPEDFESFAGFETLDDLETFEEAYHRLIMDIIRQQVASTRLVLKGAEVKRIFVDGGFGKNQVYMRLLATAFPGLEVFAASIPQATALGAALAIHSHWNTRALPGDIIGLKHFK